MNDINVLRCDACDAAFNAIYGDEFWEATDAARRVFRAGWNAGRKDMRNGPALADRRQDRERAERDARRSRSED